MVLTFLGPYIVNFVEKMDEKYSINEVMTDSEPAPPDIIEETDKEKPSDSISNNGTGGIEDTPDGTEPKPEGL